MVSSRSIPPNRTIHGRCFTFLSVHVCIKTTTVLKRTLHIVNSLLDCGINPFLIPARFRAIALQINRREIAAASIPNLKTDAFCVSIPCCNSSRAVNVRLGGLGGLRRGVGVVEPPPVEPVLPVFPVFPVLPVLPPEGVSGVVICLLLW